MSMTIGEVIAALKLCKPDALVYFSFADLRPTTVGSWRGAYAEPALGWASDEHWRRRNDFTPDMYPTAATLVTELERAIDGRTFSGWKGGEYSYEASDELHIDNRGECTYTELSRVEDGDWRVVLHTEYVGS